MKRIKLFLEYVGPSDEEQKIIDICNKYHIENYTINDDLSVDVSGSVYLNSQSLTEIPIRFGKVSGTFYAGGNKLRDFKNFPNECSFLNIPVNKFQSFEGLDRIKFGSIFMRNNPICLLTMDDLSIMNITKNDIYDILVDSPLEALLDYLIEYYVKPDIEISIFEFKISMSDLFDRFDEFEVIKHVGSEFIIDTNSLSSLMNFIGQEFDPDEFKNIFTNFSDTISQQKSHITIKDMAKLNKMGKINNFYQII